MPSVFIILMANTLWEGAIRQTMSFSSNRFYSSNEFKITRLIIGFETSPTSYVCVFNFRTRDNNLSYRKSYVFNVCVLWGVHWNSEPLALSQFAGRQNYSDKVQHLWVSIDSLAAFRMHNINKNTFYIFPARAFLMAAITRENGLRNQICNLNKPLLRFDMKLKWQPRNLERMLLMKLQILISA